MKKIRSYTIVLCLLITEGLYAQGPNDSGTYYEKADGKKGAELKTALCGVIYNREEGGDINTAYKALWTHFRTTDARPNGTVWDMYSNMREMTFGTDQAGNYKQEGDVYNREHSMPNSWFGGKVMPMYTDLHHMYPTDGYVNNKRSNFPFGETNGESYKSANNFSKLGKCTFEGYTGTVFEPNDEYKGDFARTYFYMVTCYEEKLPDWYANCPDSKPTLDGSTYPGLSNWQLAMLMKWAKNDPVSEKEINRNNTVYAIQQNRNPFIDYPELERFIWGDLKGLTFSYDNYQVPSAGFNSGTCGENLTWTCDEVTKTLTISGSGKMYNYYSFGPWYSCKSNISKVIIEEGVTYIGNFAFSDCTSITSIIIPKSVMSIGINAFQNCNTLSELIYLPIIAPDNWIATSKTYVPDIKSYSSPTYSINDAHVYEMITFDKNEFEYTGQAPTTKWTNNIEGYTASLSMSALNGDIGYHEERIPVTFIKEYNSFTTNILYRYTIKPAKLIAKVNNICREYGEDNPKFSISYSGFINGENENMLITKPTISTTATKKSNVGDYPITASGGNATNYELVYEPGVLTVTKAPLSAKVNDDTKVYGSQNPAFTIEYYGLKNGETEPAWTMRPTFQTNAMQESGVGKYEVKASNGVAVNYDLGDIEAGTLSITPAPLTIKANDATRQYYSDEPNLSYTCNGFVNGENENILSPKPTFATTANRSSNVGTYPIKVSGASNSNYSISYVDGTLTITPRTLYASVGNYERFYNEDNPAFEVKYDGFVGNEGENVLISKAIASTTATKTSDVGSYPINVTGGSADNYKFSYNSGTLTINKAEQTISWEQDLSNLKVGDQVELQAVASSGLLITYMMDGNSFAEIYSAGNSKKYLDCKAEGQFIIRATQDGNKNYYSSTRITKTVTIGNGESAVNSIDNFVIEIQKMPFGIRVINAQYGDVIRLYSTDGILYKFVKVEGQLTDIPLSKDKIYIVKIGGKTVKIGL